MKNKKIYESPDVKGIYVLQSRRYLGGNISENYEIKQKLQEKEREENRIKEFELAKEIAYKKGRLDAEHNFKSEIEKLKSEYASLMGLFQNAVNQLTEKREQILQESESEIIRLIFTISNKIVGYEINNGSMKVVKHVVKEAISCAGEKKIIAVRLSPGDITKMNTLEEMKITDQNIKIVEDRTITPGGCIVETDFGSIDSQIETRWEEIQKTLLGSKNEPTVH